MTMTEEELERRARKLCEMRGLDPDGLIRGRGLTWADARAELLAWNDCRRVMEEPVAERELKEGDRVRYTEGGYSFPGVIRSVSVFTTLSGKTRYVVECTAPGVEGCLRIFNRSQLERIS